MTEPVKIEQDVMLKLSPAHLQRVLAGLELMPLRDSRETYSEIERQVVAQVKPPQVAASRRVK